MPPESLQPEFGHTCTQPGCCSHTAAAAEAASDPEAVTLIRPETRRAVLWDSLKRYALWSLAFFGIYASSSVCVF